MSKIFYLINFILSPMLIWDLNFWKRRWEFSCTIITLEIPAERLYSVSILVFYCHFTALVQLLFHIFLLKETIKNQEKPRVLIKSKYYIDPRSQSTVKALVITIRIRTCCLSVRPSVPTFQIFKTKLLRGNSDRYWVDHWLSLSTLCMLLYVFN